MLVVAREVLTAGWAVGKMVKVETRVETVVETMAEVPLEAAVTNHLWAPGAEGEGVLAVLTEAVLTEAVLMVAGDSEVGMAAVEMAAAGTAGYLEGAKATPA